MTKQPITFNAAVVRDSGGPFVIERVSLGALRHDEVLVRVVATGMCHTDMVARDQLYPVPQPIVLGHEGAGVVEAVGEHVTKVAIGDHVVLTFLWCGRCRPCLEGMPAGCENFNDVNFTGARADGSHVLRDSSGAELNDRFFGQSSFGAYAVANERNAIKVRKDAPLDLLGPLGCGIQTGAGAVINALEVGAGASLAVFGTGAVGLSAILAAVAVGATTIVAVDVVPSRLKLARSLGATHAIDSRNEDPVAAIRAACGPGVDFALDSTGRADVIRNAVDALRPRGTCGIVGAAKPGVELALDLNGFMQTGKRLRGIVEGDSMPDVFIPKLVDLHMSGRFPFDRLVEFYALDQINEAAEDSGKGGTVKPIIRLTTI